MSNFWEKLNASLPFFTVQNITDTIKYINVFFENKRKPEHEEIKGFYIAALEYIKSALSGTATAISLQMDELFAQNAYATAEAMHDRLILNKDFCGGTRWRYVMVAVRDYIAATKVKRGYYHDR